MLVSAETYRLRFSWLADHVPSWPDGTYMHAFDFFACCPHASTIFPQKLNESSRSPVLASHRCLLLLVKHTSFNANSIMLPTEHRVLHAHFCLCAFTARKQHMTLIFTKVHRQAPAQSHVRFHCSCRQLWHLANIDSAHARVRLQYNLLQEVARFPCVCVRARISLSVCLSIFLFIFLGGVVVNCMRA